MLGMIAADAAEARARQSLEMVLRVVPGERIRFHAPARYRAISPVFPESSRFVPIVFSLRDTTNLGATPISRDGRRSRRRARLRRHRRLSVPRRQAASPSFSSETARASNLASKPRISRLRLRS